MMLSRFLSIILIFFHCEFAVAQKQYFHPENKLKNISIKQLTTEDGLASNNITSVFQDSKGLIWITSFNGFMIYDGERIDIFDKNNLSILETDGFYKILERRDGTILIGSQGSGLLQYNNGEIGHVVLKGLEVPKSIQSIAELIDGTLLIGSSNSGLYKIKGDSLARVMINPLISSSVRSIVEDLSGNVWVGTEGDGLFKISGEGYVQFKKENGLISNSVRSLALDKKGAIIIGTTEGLQWTLGQQINTFEQIGNEMINCLFIDEWNSIWMGTEQGIAWLNADYGYSTRIYSEKNIDLVRVSSIMMDSEKSVWVTSNRTGLIQIKQSNITNITAPILTSNRVYIAHESWDGNIYIGTDQNSIDVYHPDKNSSIQLKTDLGGNGIRYIYHELDGSFWLATYKGVIHLKDGVEKVYNVDFGMPTNEFRTITRDKDGNFWFGSRSGGLVKFKDGRIIKVYNKENGLNSNFVMTVKVSKSGDIYVGTQGGGMTIIRKNLNIESIHYKSDDSGIPLFNINFDDKGNVWAIINTGPLFFDGKKLIPIPLLTDKRSKTHFDMIDDGLGNFWITTNIGVMQVSKNVIYDYLDGKITEIPFNLLDENDGMNNSECTGATSSIRTKDGRLIIPTLGGLSVFNPAIDFKNETIPPVVIRNILADNIELHSSSSISKISAGTVRYAFQFSVLSYVAPQRNQYKYKLEGFDKDWSPIVYDGSVEYTNLPPSSYTFRVIGGNNSNVWNEQGDSLNFVVLPFFYQTIWFYFLLIILLIVLLFGIYRWRLSFISRQNEALKKVNAELDRFVYSASHDLRSPLSSILGLVKVARIDKETDKEIYFNHIEKSVMKMDSFIRDIIDYSRNARLDITPEKIDFEKLIKDILDDISYISNYKKIVCNVQIDPGIEFYSDSKRVRIVLSNIISNAYKHHIPEERNPATIDISVIKDKAGAKVEIADNGTGIETKYQKEIFKMFYRATNRSEGSGLGLYIVQETLQKIGSTIRMESEKDKGTKFIIHMKSIK